MDIFFKLQHFAWGGCHWLFVRRLQPIPQPIHQHGDCPYQETDENLFCVGRYGNGNTDITFQISHKAMVRASSHKTIFEYNYMPNWLTDHFTVIQEVLLRNGAKLRVYKFINYNNERVKGN